MQMRLMAAAAALVAALPAAMAGADRPGVVPPSPGRPWTPPEAARPKGIPSTAPPPLFTEKELQQPRVFSLPQVIEIALANSPAAREAWFVARAAAEDWKSKRAAFFPEIDLTIGLNRQKQTAVGGQFKFLQTTWGPSAVLGGPPGDGSAATLTYTLFDFGGRKADMDEAHLALFAADWSHDAAVQNLILLVEQAYFQYQNAKEQAAAAESNVREAQENLDAAQARHDAGVATIADVLQAQTALSQAKLDLATARGQIETLRGALVTAAGFPASFAKLPIDVEALPEHIDAGATQEDVDALVKKAEESRPDLAASRENALAALSHVRYERSLGLPVLGLSASAGRTYYVPQTANRFTTSWAIGAQLKFPVFNGFQTTHNIRKADEQARAAIAGAESLEQQVILEVWTSYADLDTARERLTAAGDLLRSASQSEEVALGRYKEGVGSILDLLAAQSALAAARAQDAQARAGWFLALAQLAHDTGALQPSSAPTATKRD